MKFKTDKTAAGLTTVALREKEDLLVVEDRTGEIERIDIDFTTHQIRVYSNGSWDVGRFWRNGTPADVYNPLVAVVLRFRDGSALRQDFKEPVPQSVAAAALGRLVGELGGQLDMKPEVKNEDRH